MGASYLISVVWAFALIAILLVGLTYVARAIQRGRIVSSATGGRRLVTTVETTALAQNVTVHVVKVGPRYFLIGGGTAGLSMLTELPPDEIEPYIESQRVALTQQRESLLRPFARFKKS